MIIKFYVAFTSHVIYKLMSFVNFYVWSCDHELVAMGTSIWNTG